MMIRAGTEHAEALSPLIAAFRQELRALKGMDKPADRAAAREEFLEYLDKEYPVYCYMENDQPLGCAVCRAESGTVWCESLYVLPQARRRGIAAALFRQAEQFAETLGESMDYHYVHPNNHRIIAFLKKQGYDVLNLIEIRKALPGEAPAPGFAVGEHSFRC